MGAASTAESLFNRLEEVVLPAYPVVREGKRALSLYTDRVLLSGSGPTIFGLFDSRKEAIRAKNHLARDGRWQLFVTRTV
jgi:4-diphosphocytidyl-2-C-methyl-D-erythritol kinase